MATFQSRRAGRWAKYNSNPENLTRRRAAWDAARIAGPAPSYPPDAPLHGDWLGGRINGHTVIVRLMRDPTHRCDQWAAEIDGERVGLLSATQIATLIRDRIPKRPRELYVTVDQVRAIAAAADPITRDVVLFAALTGLRRSEILRLRPGDVRGTDVIVSARSKSGRARVVPMPAEAARIAKRLPFSIGVPLLTKRFNAARVAAGLPDIRLHDLRHAYGTWLAEAGTDGPTIRDMMGHSSLTVTSRYLQSAGDSAKRAAAKLPRLGSGRGQKKA